MRGAHRQPYRAALRERAALRVHPSPRLRVVVTDGRGGRVRDRGLIRWLPQVAPAAARHGEVAVAIVTDGRMRALNRRFRGIDRPTDVLSFRGSGTPPVPVPSSREEGQIVAGYPTPTSIRFLGDIVIATGVARRQARAAGHAVHVELKRLALHGLLHVLGYDHARDTGEMHGLERRLRRKGGLPED